MPIWLRRFYLEKLKSTKEQERAAQERANKGQSGDGTIHRPPSFKK
tara:strand:- start:326 stop:463 length:138 start_codon:yes stop_codon:yes gene_type:complete